MSNFSPVPSWDSRVYINEEGAYPANFGTPATPTAAQAMEHISLSLGVAETGAVRAQKDRGPGRGMTNKYTEGRVGPMSFTGSRSVRSRAAADTVPQESVLYAASGLHQVVNSGTSVVYSTPADPVSGSDFQSLSIYRVLGAAGSAAMEAEWMRGCVVKTLKLSGGDKDLLLDYAGAGIGKATVGLVSSVTLDNSQTTYALLTTEEAYRLNNALNSGFGHLYMQIESEIIDITSVSVGTHTITFARAALSSSAAAHTAKPLYPYVPAVTGYAGSPISEPVSSVSIDGVAIRCMSWEFNLKSTGIDLLPGETNSKHIQGIKVLRYDAEVRAKLVLHGDDVSLLGKATSRGTCAWSLVQGGTAGGIVTVAGAYSEVMPFAVPDTAGDDAIVDVQLRLRDNSGNDMFTITYS
jgi:hypothetical protein